MLIVSFECTDRVASPWTKAKPTKGRSSSASLNKPLRIRDQERISQDATKDETEEDTSLSSPGSDEDGFFSLETDLDLNKLDLNAVDERCLAKTSAQSAVDWASTTTTRRLAREPDTLGNLEYKLRLLPPTRHRYDRLLTQLKWRLLQGGGYCTCVGICPIEMRASLRVLASLASELGASLRVRRAFVLVEAECGKGKLLHSLSNREAQGKLLHQGALDGGEEQESPTACKCLADADAWPEANILGKHLEAEAVDGSEVYQVDIEDATGTLLGGSWLGGSDESEEEQVDDCEDDVISQGETYSLSLDELATRSGINYQQNRPRRRCRYQGKSAQHRRQKEASLTSPSDALVGEDRSASSRSRKPRPKLVHHTVSDGIVQTGELQPCDEAASLKEATAVVTCERLIVEAIVSRPEEEQEASFIDYASL
jgi:hypothetical protein